MSLLFFLHRFFFWNFWLFFFFFGHKSMIHNYIGHPGMYDIWQFNFFRTRIFLVGLCVFFDRFSIDRCVFVCQFSSYFPLFLLLLFFFICKIIVFVCVCSEVVVVTHTHAHTDYTWKCNCSILSCPYKKMIIPVSKLKIIKSGQQQHCRL